MSSKWPMSAKTLPSSLSKEWKDDDFELLDIVMPGGESRLGRGLFELEKALCSPIMAAWHCLTA